MFYGRGAGKLPTASAVIADIIDIVRHNEVGKNLWIRREFDNTVPFEDSETRYFVRVVVRNYEEALKYIRKVFGTVEIVPMPGKDSVSCENPGNELAFTTSRAVRMCRGIKRDSFHQRGSQCDQDRGGVSR